MAKFSGAQSATGPSALDQASVQLPVPQAPEAEAAPAAPAEGGGSILDTIQVEDVAAQPTAQAGLDEETAAAVAEGIEMGIDAQERGRVPTITERSKQEVSPIRWNPQIGRPPVASVDGGLAARAKNMAEMFGNNNNWEGGLGIAPSATPEMGGLSGAFARIGAINSQEKVAKPDGTAGFQTTIDPMFLQIGSAVTENVMTRLAEGQTAVLTHGGGMVDQDGETITDKGQISKSQSNAEIGREANREYQRVKNAQQGLPTDQYTDISNDEASVLGDALKEMYAASNPNDMKRITPQGAEGQVFFQLTPEGATRLNSPEAKFKRAQLFPGVNVRPEKTAPRKGKLQSEVGRVATKGRTGHVKGKPKGTEVIEQSMSNMSTVANVVDKQRMKILYATALPALMSQDTTWMSDINNFGSDSVKKFNAEQKKREREAAEQGKASDYNAAQELESLKRNVAQGIRAVAMERNGANYLTYYMQNFNGRTAPQQSFFDPTTSKAVRFVTRNAIPAEAKPNSRVEANLRQMYAMMLVKGADSLLPAERDAAFARALPQLEAWGKELQEALNNAITDQQAEAISQAIEEGRPLTEIQMPNLNETLQNEELKQKIASKGEDGPHFIDGLIDVANYAAAQRAGKPYFSYFNAYMDGKTNGIASNGIQMGSREVALKTGVMRTGQKELLDEGDIRDDLMKNLQEELDTSGLSGSDPNLYTIMRSVYSYRQLAKDTTMTFGYGKELESFMQDIDGALDLMIESDPEVAAAYEALMVDGDRGSLLETMWTQYTNHLGSALSEEAMTSRPLMRAAATYFALMDKPMSIETATGLELRLGGEVAEGVAGEASTSQQYYMYDGDKKVKVTAQEYATRSSGIAAKGDQGVGSRVWGGSLPGPVQSLDAATIALTTTGRSWDRLKMNSKGNPYFHHVYDAVKVDAMGFDVVLEEVNKNWLQASMDWSYLEATQKSLQENMAEHMAEINTFPDSMPILTGPTDTFAMFGELAIETPSQKGNVGPWNLAKRINKIMDSNTIGEEKFKEAVEKAQKIMKYMKSQGYDQDKPTIKDYKNFMKAFAHEINLNQRLGNMIAHTNKKKAQLKSEMNKLKPSKRSTTARGHTYDLSAGGQYYAH